MLINNYVHSFNCAMPAAATIAANTTSTLSSMSAVPPVATECSAATIKPNCSSTLLSAFRFTADQVMCLCEALQQASDIDRLAHFIASLDPGELAAGGESVLRARATVAFH